MRHEERYNTTCVYTDLTLKGTNNANNQIYNLLNEKKITQIYTSPYKRCLNTINKYSTEKKIKPKIEYSIAEFNLLLYSSDINYILNDFDYDTEYISFNSLEYTNKNICNINDSIRRIHSFIIYILEKYKTTNEKILIVTHMTNINIILYLINRVYYKDVIKDKFHSTGKIIEIL